MTALFHIAVFVMATSAPQVKQKVEVRPVEAGVCDLIASPAAFNGKLVRFTAQFESDGIERSILLGETCPQKGGLMPYVVDGATGAKAFDDAIYLGHPGTLDKTITATFTGTFHYLAKPEMCMFASQEACRRTFAITDISNLVLVMKQKR
jgi:hypothetical protein